jgi:type I restriction enzyme R subunit
MPTPGEHKTVQARILEYAEAIGWTIVSREEADQRRGFEPPSPSGLWRSGPEVPSADRARNRSLFFDDLLDAKVRQFNPRYAEAEGALLGQFPPSSRTTAGQAGANFSTTRRSLSAT